MKCGDCIEACPQEALKFGWTTPPAFREHAPPANSKLFRLSRKMEGTILLVWLAAFFGFHGLYNLFPLLMAAGMAALAGDSSGEVPTTPSKKAWRARRFGSRFEPAIFFNLPV